jgi:hypothetical protein
MTPQDDPLSAIKGIVWAIPVSLALWFALVAFALGVVR